METANSRLTPTAAAAAALDESPAGGAEMQQPRLQQQQQQHQLQQQNQQQHQQQGRDSLYQQDINTQVTQGSGAEGSYPNLDRSELDGNSANLLMMNVAHSLSQSGITCSDVLDAIKASAGVMDTSDEHTYGMSLNGRLSPPAQAQCYGNTYATLTPLQPLPPISTVAEKFGGLPGSCAMPGGGFVFMQQNDLNLAGAAYGANAYAYKSYPKESTIQTSVTNRASYSAMEVISSAAMVNANTYGQQQIQRNICSSPYSMQFGHHSDMMSSVKSEQSGQDGLIAAQSSYGTYATSLVSSSSVPIKNLQQSMAPIGLNIGMSLVPSHLGQHQSTIASHSQGDLSPAQDQPSSSTDMQDDMSCSEKEEINTREIALKVSNELKKYSIPQAVFAQRVLGRSQGTLSDLLRNPKPWSKLKSGRETFRRMWKWLQEPEYQRMSQLRVMSAAAVDLQMFHERGGGVQSFSPSEVSVCSLSSKQMSSPGSSSCKRSRDGMLSHPDSQSMPSTKKPRMVFTEIQRRTLVAIFKEIKRPSKEIQATIAEQLGLKVSTVVNFFMNARRRSVDKYMDDATEKDAVSNAVSSTACSADDLTGQ